VALEYEVASDISGCPGLDKFKAAVERPLGYDPFKLGAETRVAVQIARRETGFSGRIQWSDAQGRWVGDRQLSSKHADCGPIAASLAFAVAVQIQLLATLAPPPPPPPPVPEVRATSMKQAEAPPAPPAAPDRQRALYIGFAPSLALALAPEPTGYGRLFATGRIARFSLELALGAALPATRQESGAGGFSLDRLDAGAATCGHARAFAACFTVTLGVLRARGFGVDLPQSPAGPFSQAGARLAATHEFGGRYFAAVRVDALVMLSSYTVTLNQAAAWTTPRVGGLVGLDVGVRIF
jgi:hypothetical protein